MIYLVFLFHLITEIMNSDVTVASNAFTVNSILKSVVETVILCTGNLFFIYKVLVVYTDLRTKGIINADATNFKNKVSVVHFFQKH